MTGSESQLAESRCHWTGRSDKQKRGSASHLAESRRPGRSTRLSVSGSSCARPARICPASVAARPAWPAAVRGERPAESVREIKLRMVEASAKRKTLKAHWPSRVVIGLVDASAKCAALQTSWQSKSAALQAHKHAPLGIQTQIEALQDS